MGRRLAVPGLTVVLITSLVMSWATAAMASPAAPVNPAATGAAAVQSAPGATADNPAGDPDGDKQELAETAAVATLDESAWGPCQGATLTAVGAQCTMLTLPLDYDDPHGTTISLALSRVKHTVPDDQYQGIMLLNPGGPGGSGLVFADRKSVV